MSTEEKRVVLVKPGDVLLIGNVKISSHKEAEQVSEWLRKLGLSPVLLFSGDVQIDQVSADQLRDLLARVEGDQP